MDKLAELLCGLQKQRIISPTQYAELISELKYHDKQVVLNAREELGEEIKRHHRSHFWRCDEFEEQINQIVRGDRDYV